MAAVSSEQDDGGVLKEWARLASAPGAFDSSHMTLQSQMVPTIHATKMRINSARMACINPVTKLSSAF
jgi:hypothetical protein